LAVRAENATLPYPLHQTVEGLLCRVAKTVVDAGGDDRYQRVHGVQEALSTGASAAVIGHFHDGGALLSPAVAFGGESWRHLACPLPTRIGRL